MTLYDAIMHFPNDWQVLPLYVTQPRGTVLVELERQRGRRPVP